MALEKAPGFAAVAKQTQSDTNAKKESMKRCAQRDSYNVYFSAAAIGFACSTSGRRRCVSASGRRRAGSGDVGGDVFGLTSCRRGPTSAAALGAAAARAKRAAVPRRGMVSIGITDA